VVTTLTAASATSMTITNTGSQLATVGTYTSSASLTSLTLSGNVQIGDGLVGGTGATFTSTNGITIAGATDNAHVKLSLGGAAVGQTNSITVGDGNNTIVDATKFGTVNLTVGTGSNFLVVGGDTTNTTGQFNITLGAGTGASYVTVGTGGTAYATAANYVITGAQSAIASSSTPTPRRPSRPPLRRPPPRSPGCWPMWTSWPRMAWPGPRLAGTPMWWSRSPAPWVHSTPRW
jgi:hypothetical protein